MKYLVEVKKDSMRAHRARKGGAGASSCEITVLFESHAPAGVQMRFHDPDRTVTFSVEEWLKMNGGVGMELGMQPDGPDDRDD